MLVFVVFFFVVFFFVVFVFMLFVGGFDFFDIGVSGGFNLLFRFRFFVGFFFIFELGAANLRHGFDAVLGLFVLGFNERGREGSNLIIAEVRIAAAVLGNRGVGSEGLGRCRDFFRLRKSGFGFGAGFGEKPAGQAAR